METWSNASGGPLLDYSTGGNTRSQQTAPGTISLPPVLGKSEREPIPEFFFVSTFHRGSKSSQKNIALQYFFCCKKVAHRLHEAI
jgi:hypothetical protein